MVNIHELMNFCLFGVICITSDMSDFDSLCALIEVPTNEADRAVQFLHQNSGRKGVRADALGRDIAPEWMTCGTVIDI